MFHSLLHTEIWLALCFLLQTKQAASQGMRFSLCLVGPPGDPLGRYLSPTNQALCAE